MENMGIILATKEFWTNKKVFITGHTGFKGSWLSLLLHRLGAEIYGYSLDPPTDPSLYDYARIDELIDSTIGDIRDFDYLLETLKRVKPEIVIHMAAQSLVRESYKNPRETYEVNVIGTVNLFDAVRYIPDVKAMLNITTDKCYENREWLWGYRENESLGGYDPYSNSKACSELITASFRSSFFNPDISESTLALASARAGNVIGGGDWAEDRLIPDFFRAILNGEKVRIRSPYAIRPWQFVLEPLNGYLLLAEKLFKKGSEYAEAWNFGPDDIEYKNVEWVIDTLCRLWGEDASFEIDKFPGPHEANFLKLDCSKSKTKLKWQPQWNIESALRSIVEWNKAFVRNEDLRDMCFKQIELYYSSAEID